MNDPWVNENSCCFIVMPRLCTVDNDLRTEQNNYGQTSSSHSDMTALKSFENGAKLKRNAFQCENLIVYHLFGAY